MTICARAGPVARHRVMAPVIELRSRALFNDSARQRVMWILIFLS